MAQWGTLFIYSCSETLKGDEQRLSKEIERTAYLEGVTEDFHRSTGRF